MQKWQEKVKDVEVFIKHGLYQYIFVFAKGGSEIRTCKYTVAIVRDTVTGARAYGVAKTHPDDQFSRKIGRAIATGRAKKLLADMLSIGMVVDVLDALVRFDTVLGEWVTGIIGAEYEFGLKIGGQIPICMARSGVGKTTLGRTTHLNVLDEVGFFADK